MNRLRELEQEEEFSSALLQKILEFLIDKNQEIKLNQKNFSLNQEIKQKVNDMRAQI